MHTLKKIWSHAGDMPPRNRKSPISFTGAYVPLVMEGKIIVDEVLASCYADFHHDLAHLTMVPMQRFSVVMNWIFGEDAGFSVFVSTARGLGILLLPDAHIWSY